MEKTLWPKSPCCLLRAWSYDTLNKFKTIILEKKNEKEKKAYFTIIKKIKSTWCL